MSKIFNSLTPLIMEAVKDHDHDRAQAYKNLKSKLLEWKTSKEGARVCSENLGEIPDSVEITVIQKMVSELKGDIVSFGDRQDLIDEARTELLWLEPMLPKEPTDEEIKEIIDAWTGSYEKRSMGAIVKFVKEKLPGAQGKKISDLVRGYLV